MNYFWKAFKDELAKLSEVQPIPVVKPNTKKNKVLSDNKPEPETDKKQYFITKADTNT